MAETDDLRNRAEELQLLKADGTQFHAQLDSTAVSGHGGRRDQIRMTVTDISALIPSTLLHFTPFILPPNARPAISLAQERGT